MRVEKYLSDEDKKVYTLISVMVTLFLIVCFNLLFAPLIFLAYMLYIIYNKNMKLSTFELSILFLFVLPFLGFSIIARFFGFPIGLIIMIPIIVVALLILLYKKLGGGV
ncbi:MAG: hypothetical protein DRN08_05775 [Thermoplasmata archaeon]|nr:MAG: hypothetical protein DRN08_05775 [Thermoplasmata archaeon]